MDQDAQPHAQLLTYRRLNAHVRCSTPVFWLCFWYLLGSLLFLLAAICGWPHQARENGLVNVPYAAGSLAFALGAWCLARVRARVRVRVRVRARARARARVRP